MPQPVPARLRAAGLALGLIVAISPCPALPPDIPLSELTLDRWTTKEGLPSSLVASVLALDSGHLLLSSEDSLVRFNGAEFERLELPAPDAQTLPIVNELATDTRGRAWACTSRGLMCLERGKVRLVSPGKIGNLQMGLIAADPHGGVWLHDQKRLYRITDPDTMPTIHEASGGGFTTQVAADGSGGAWVCGTRGLLRFREGEWRTVVEATRFGGAPQGLLPDKDGRVLVGCKGLYAIDPLHPELVTVVPGTEDLLISALKRDREGSLWIGTRKGLFRLTAAGLEEWTGNGASHGETAPHVISLIEDQDGALWIGTANAGLLRLRISIAHTVGRGAGLAGDDVTAVLETRDHSLLIATEEGLFCRKPDQGMVPVPIPGMKRPWARALYEDSKGRLWVSGMDGVHLRESDGTWRVFPADHQHNPAGARAFKEDREGRIWAGSMKGLYEFKGDHFEAAPSHPEHPSVLALELDAGGQLWGAGEGGVGQIADGYFTPIPNTQASVGLGLGADGSLWAGQMGGGLLRIREGRIQRYTISQGLPATSSYAVLDDHRGFLWISSSRGLYRIALSELDAVSSGGISHVKAHHYGMQEGLLDQECNAMGSPALFRTRAGKICVPTVKGMGVLDPERIAKACQAPKVETKDIYADGHAWQLDKPLTFPAGTSHVRIRYSGISLSAPRQLSYTAKLEGFEERWSDLGEQRSIQFVNLKPGAYVFRVKAVQALGQSESKELTVPFEIRPYFWQRSGFHAVMGSLTVLGLFAGDRLRHRAAKRRETELRKRIEEEMAKVRILSGLLPICAWCKEIKDEGGNWMKMEQYITQRSEAKFTHGMCPKCYRKMAADSGISELELGDPPKDG